MKLIRVIVLLGATGIVQISPAQDRDASAPQENAAKAATESAEHMYARHEYARVLNVVFSWGTAPAQASKSVEMVEKFARDPYDPRTYIEWPELEAVEKRLKLLRLRMDSADVCLNLYRETIDRKLSDLTTRESDQITACKSIDNYPPYKPGDSAQTVK